MHILSSATHKIFCIRQVLKANSTLRQLSFTISIDFKNTNVLEVMIVKESYFIEIFIRLD